MTLHRGVVVGSRSARSVFSCARVRIGVLTLLFTSCSSAPTRVPGEGGSGGGPGVQGGTGAGEFPGGTGGGTGGTASGGTGGSGGAGGDPGGAGKLDASPGNLFDGSPAGGSPDGGNRLDGGSDIRTPSAEGTWEKLNLVLANCIYCHNENTKRLDLQERGLYDRLVNKSAAVCANRTLVVPGQPMMSLLYLKLAGTMPTGCGERMPYKKPAVSATELGMVFDWITAGAPKM